MHHNGLLASSTPEPEWDDLQQGWMLALGEYRASRCPCGCGYALKETTEGGGVFSVPLPVRCYARTALSIAQDASNRPQPEALLWRAEMR